MKIFLDTNILLDIVDDRRSNHKEAINILQDDEIECCCVADSILTINYILRKENFCLEAIAMLSQAINLLDTQSEHVISAIAIAKNQKFKDVEDICKILCATGENCEAFITSDKNIESDNIPVVSPSDFLGVFGYKKALDGNWEKPNPQILQGNYTTINEPEK